MPESEEELKSMMMRVKGESGKAGLRLNIQKTKIMASGPIMANRWGKMATVTDCILGAPKSLQTLTAAMKLKDTCSLEENLGQTRQHIKKQRHYFVNIGPSSQGYGFSSSHVWM